MTDQDAKVKIKKLFNKDSNAKKSKAEMEKNKRKRVNLTDPESRSMLTSEGVFPAFNQQVVVDSKNHFIIAEDVISDETDYHQLNSLVDKSKEILPAAERIVADAGYYNGPELVSVEGKIDCYVALNESTSKKAEGFTYDRNRDLYICPKGKELVYYRDNYWEGRKYRVYGKIKCDECPLRLSCVDSRRTHKAVWRYVHEDIVERHREKVLKPEDQKIIKKRKTIIEHIFGNIKLKAGKMPILRKGLLNSKAEGALHCLSYNFIRLMNVISCKEIIALIENLKGKLAFR